MIKQTNKLTTYISNIGIFQWLLISAVSMHQNKYNSIVCFPTTKQNVINTNMMLMMQEKNNVNIDFTVSADSAPFIVSLNIGV